jgi:hypothetical protein
MPKKLSIDLTDENFQTLQSLKKNPKVPYGQAINDLITTFADPPEKVRHEMLNVLTQKLQIIRQQIDTAGKYEAESLATEYAAYTDMARIFNYWNYLDESTLTPKPVMKKVPLKNGYLVCPENWIILNPKACESCSYAAAIEVHNAVLPYFIWINNHSNADEFTDQDFSTVQKLCEEAYPDFKEMVSDKMIDPIPDPAHPGAYLNLTEWMAAPSIGIYSIYVDGDESYGSDYDPPFGTKIIRNNERERSLNNHVNSKEKIEEKK